VLLDDRIASQDPHELTQLIAAASQSGEAIIAMIHCDNLAADISRLQSMKIETYLVKPIDSSELAKSLHHVLCDGSAEVPPATRRDSNSAGQPPIVGRPLKILFADDSTDNRILIRAFLKKTPLSARRSRRRQARHR